MKNFLLLIFVFFVSQSGYCQKSETKVKANIQEYDLENGLHVIMSPDSTSPIVCVGMMYHVGSKNENESRTGFAHLFEHLLFYGTENIPKDQIDIMLRSVGGYSNASTNADRTYYYSILPAHQYRLGLWIEAERLYHPIMTQQAIDREREVVKEESRQRYDLTALGRASEDMLALEYKTTPYRWPTIGSMAHLDAASIDDFKAFSNQFYVPNNACLILTGNVNIEDSKKYIAAYFNRIPRGKAVIQPVNNEKYFGGEEVVEIQKKGIKEPHAMISYGAVPQNQRDAKVLEFIIAYLSRSEGPLKNLELDKKNGITKIGATPEFYEIAGSTWFRASFKDSIEYRVVVDKIEQELDHIKKGIDQQKMIEMKASYESGYIDMYYDAQYLGECLGLYHFIWKDTRKINGLIDEYLSITNQEIMTVAQKYFVPSNRKIVVYHPKK